MSAAGVGISPASPGVATRRTIESVRHSVGGEARGTGVGFQKPDGAGGIVADELVVLQRAEVAGPDHAGGVDIGGVVHPFILEDVVGPVADEDELFAGQLIQLAS